MQNSTCWWKWDPSQNTGQQKRMQKIHRNPCKTPHRNGLPNVAQKLSQMLCGNTKACYDVISHGNLQACTLQYIAVCKYIFNICSKNCHQALTVFIEEKWFYRLRHLYHAGNQFCLYGTEGLFSPCLPKTSPYSLRHAFSLDFMSYTSTHLLIWASSLL